MDALDPASRSLLAEGRQLHVGVLTTSGPHVTPELYTGDARRLWFLTAADTLKTRVVRRDPRVAGVVRVGSRSLLVAGTATAYDVGDPLRLLARSRDAVAALAALSSYTVRNAADLLAFGRDLAAGRLPSRLPPRRVLMRMRPDRVVGLETGDGMVVLPGRSDTTGNGRTGSTASVPAVAVQLAGAPLGTQARGCLVVDDYRAPGPAAKRGELLRGTLGLELDGARCQVRLDPDRDTRWDGARTRTTRV